MKTLHIGRLTAAAKMRKSGYLEAFEKVGQRSQCGQWIYLSDEDYAAIRAQFNPFPSTPASKSINVHFQPSRGWGDVAHSIAGPIGRALNLPCLKGDGTTALRPDSKCARLQKNWNQVKVPKSIDKVLKLIGI